MKKTVLIAAMLFMLTGILSTGAAASSSVDAVISPFSLELVFTPYYNAATEYPVLLYKNVSYIPLTSAMCNELYLSAAFTEKDGFYLARGGGRGEIGTERTELLGAVDYKNPPSGRISAVIPDYPVFINGREYDSKTSEYPILNFRGITYLPLTYDIIKNEFDFEFSFDNEKKHLVLHGNSWYSVPSFTFLNEDYLEISDYKSVYSESIDENGFVKYTHEYDYTDYYRLSLADEAVLKMPSDYKPAPTVREEPKASDPRLTVKDGYAYFEDVRLLKIPSYGYDYDDYASADVYEYDDISFIVVTTWSSLALPRGTTRRNSIFVKDENGITKLEWSDTFSELLYDGNGSWYLCSSSGEQSWGNRFAEIYRYTKENGLERLSDRYENLNSLEYIGSHNGKLYVFGALRSGNRDVAYSGDSLNPMYSGYYEIDTDLSIRKIGNYMGSRANVILANNGNLYAITAYSTVNRLVNIKTGKIIFEL